jgi:hypothetical protein
MHETAVTAIPATTRVLRLEAAAALLVAVIAYQAIGPSWWLFAAIFLLPDLSLLGYLAGPQKGALVYNAVHSYAAPLILGSLSFVSGGSIGLAIAIVWFAHVAFDRVLGYGLKHVTGFHDTHLGPIGRR